MVDPDILDEEGGGDGDELIVAGAAAAGAALVCLSCETKIVGPYCHACGQKNDDMRRSVLRLARDFVEDTFSFDSRMWRTLGLIATRPGLVPTSYSHGRRSRFTPPVRLFIVVSFLFFLTLGLTKTMFAALEVRESPNASESATDGSPAGVVVNDLGADCNMNARIRFFVQPDDLEVDAERWRRCRESIMSMATTGVESAENVTITSGEEVIEGDAAKEEAVGWISHFGDLGRR